MRPRSRSTSAATSGRALASAGNFEREHRAGPGAPGARRLQEPPGRHRLPRAADAADQHRRLPRAPRGRPRALDRAPARRSGRSSAAAPGCPGSSRSCWCCTAPPTASSRAPGTSTSRASSPTSSTSTTGRPSAASIELTGEARPAPHLGARGGARARARRRQPGRQRRQVHPRRRSRRRHPRAASRRGVLLDLHRRRHRHLVGGPGARVRGVLPVDGPGRDPPVRHRAGPGDRAPDRGPARRPDRARVGARRGQHVPGLAAGGLRISRRGCAAAAPRPARPARTPRGAAPRWRRGPGCPGPRRR